jgi:hypothetical protein
LKVEARFGGKAKYFSGTIVKDNGDGTCEIHYDDGDSEKAVAHELISAPSPAGTYQAGEKVESRFGGKHVYFGATVVKDNGDGTWELKYDDGDSEKSAKYLRPMPGASTRSGRLPVENAVSADKGAHSAALNEKPAAALTVASAPDASLAAGASSGATGSILVKESTAPASASVNVSVSSREPSAASNISAPAAAHSASSHNALTAAPRGSLDTSHHVASGTTDTTAAILTQGNLQTTETAAPFAATSEAQTLLQTQEVHAAAQHDSNSVTFGAGGGNAGVATVGASFLTEASDGDRHNDKLAWSGLGGHRKGGRQRQMQSREGLLAERTDRATARPAFHLSNSRRALLAATRKMGFPPEKSAAERQARMMELAQVKPKKHYLEEHPEYIARRKADHYSDRSAFASLDEVRNCTFIPKVGKNWGENSATKSNGCDDDEEKKEDDPMVQFMKRSDAWGRKTREDRAAATGRQAYEALLTRKVCPDCKHPDGKPVYQAYDEYIEKRDVCAACGKKYVRQSAWGDVKEDFFSNAEAYAAAKERHLAELTHRYVVEANDLRQHVKKVYDPLADVTRTAPLFATCRDEDESEEVTGCIDVYFS